nr:ribonuclease H-like domain, reverse transcriptase, RNA-dependent DNA polymerase [Tanacetum cinerariifolium]
MVVIWNPTVRKSVGIDILVPKGMYIKEEWIVVGFGVCSDTSDLKLVKIIDDKISSMWVVEVFTLRFRSNGEVVMELDDDNYKDSRIAIYEPLSGHINDVGINGDLLLSRFMQEPEEQHMKAIKKVLHYVKGTKDYRITYKHNGATAAATQALWLKRLLSRLTHSDEEKITILVDNKSAIALTKNPVFHGRSNHIDTKYHFIRECVERDDIQTYKAPFVIRRENIRMLVTTITASSTNSTGRGSANGSRIRLSLRRSHLVFGSEKRFLSHQSVQNLLFESLPNVPVQQDTWMEAGWLFRGGDMQNAMENENYALAAEIRDKMS